MADQLLKILAVAAGGALGSVCRYLLGLLPNSLPIPIWTLAVNILGAVAIGFVIGHQNSLSTTAYAGLKTGFCGGFTTFSTFSQETLALIEGHHVVLGCVYAGLSLVSCVFGVLLGRRLAA